MKARITITAIILASVGFANFASAQLPDPGVTIVEGRTALLITDPQNDFLSKESPPGGMVGPTVRKHKVVEKEPKLKARAKEIGIPDLYSTNQCMT